MTDLRSAAVSGLVLAGLFAGALVGPGAEPLAAVAAATCLLAPWLRRFVWRLPWSALTAGLLVAAPPAWWWGFSAPELLVVLLAWLQVHRRCVRADAADDRASIALAGLSLLVAAGRVDDPTLGLPVLVWWALLPIAAFTVPVSPRVAVVASTGVGVLAAVGFFALPRVVRAEVAVDELTGFAPQVELGELDELLDDPAVVFRAELHPTPKGPLYWRGLALDRFDGRQWSGDPSPVPVELLGPLQLPPESVVIEVEPSLDGQVLFTAGRVVDLVVSGASVLGDGAGGFRATEDPERYRIVALPPFGPGAPGPRVHEPDPAVLARATRLPADLDPRVRALAASVAGEGDATSQVDRLAAYLSTGFGYTRRPGDRGLQDPLEQFLFERRSGHCEYFATALAVMVRARGVPARVVNGFLGGEVDPVSGLVTVRRYHAHAWTEVYLDGWVAIDATPSRSPPPTRGSLGPLSDRLRTAWEQLVLEYDRSDQAAAVWSVSRRVEAVLPASSSPAVPWRGLVVVVVVGLGSALATRHLVRRATRRWLDVPPPWPVGPVDRAHARARRHLSSLGFEAPAALPPVEAAAWFARQCPGDAAEALLELAWLYYEVHLGGADASAAAGRARALSDRVVALPRSSREGRATGAIAGSDDPLRTRVPDGTEATGHPNGP